MPQVAAIASAVGPIIGGIIGNSNASSDRDAARNAANQAYRALQEIGLPPDLSAPIIMQQFQQAGILTPELEEHINLGPSAMEGVQSDKELASAQREALDALRQRGKTGFSAQERADLERVRSEVARDQQAKQQQILQQMQARGMGGSGAELAAALQSSQSDTNREAQQALDIASLGNQRALESLTKGGNLAGSIREQDFSEASKRAQSKDAFSKLDYESQLAQQQRNTAAKNQAQILNLQNLQNAQDANIGNANKEALRQAKAKEDFWQNRLAQATGQASNARAASQGFLNSAQQQANQGTTIGAGIGQAFGAFAPGGGYANLFGQPIDKEFQADLDQAEFEAQHNKPTNVGTVQPASIYDPRKTRFA